MSTVNRLVRAKGLPPLSPPFLQSWMFEIKKKTWAARPVGAPSLAIKPAPETRVRNRLIGINRTTVTAVVFNGQGQQNVPRLSVWYISLAEHSKHSKAVGSACRNLARFTDVAMQQRLGKEHFSHTRQEIPFLSYTNVLVSQSKGEETDIPPKIHLVTGKPGGRAIPSLGSLKEHPGPTRILHRHKHRTVVRSIAWVEDRVQKVDLGASRILESMDLEDVARLTLGL
ncbi:hypothetical protein EDD15DRAFT_2204107 [Pisolithus albus]|nr:hypothetical protein EDD15DRAFT_2204107 [Pisolithus albus]